MQKGIIGKKIGMTQIFDEAGKVIPVTVVEAGPCVVVQKKTAENDGYEAVQLGYGDIRAKRVNKPLQGHFKKADVAMKRTLKEFRLADTSALNVGDIVKADTFAAGDIVDAVQARVTDSPVRSSVTTTQDLRKLTVQVLYTDMQVLWVLVHHLQESSRARVCLVSTVT